MLSARVSKVRRGRTAECEVRYQRTLRHLRQCARRYDWPLKAARWAACLTLLIAYGAASAAIPQGKAELTLDIDGTPLTLYTYKPEQYSNPGVLLTLHGVGRNAEGYRDHAIPLAERLGLLVVAPYFDRERYPTWRYQHGGIARRASGAYTPEPEARHTGRIFTSIVDAVRRLESAPDAPYYLLGHSGGAQSLSRVAGFMPTGAKRLVLANAGSYLWPAAEVRFPDGYAGILDGAQSEAALRRYLAQPITLVLGTADVKQDADLTQRESALAQGPNRYERGHNFFRAAQSLAKARGWAFNWKLIEVPGVGHSARRMFGAEAMIQAFGD